MMQLTKIPWEKGCKFLGGGFFRERRGSFLLYLTSVPVPMLGLGFVVTPEINGLRSIGHFILFLVFFYLGFIRK
jgi:hypothetical protein